MQKLLWMALAGALGTLARYLLSGLVQRLNGTSFPWGTLAVNGLGCLLFGLVWSLAEEGLAISGETRMIVLAGFMGAFTTFSTLIFETGGMLRDTQWGLAVVNMGGQVAVGLLALFIGLAGGRLLMTGRGF